MKTYYKECKTAKQAVSYLKRIGLEDFVDAWYLTSEEFMARKEFDYDSWQEFDSNDKPLSGVSIVVTFFCGIYEVSVAKYKAKDLEVVGES